MELRWAGLNDDLFCGRGSPIDYRRRVDPLMPVGLKYANLTLMRIHSFIQRPWIF